MILCNFKFFGKILIAIKYWEINIRLIKMDTEPLPLSFFQWKKCQGIVKFKK